VYNRERLVSRTIQSLLEQTYKNLELVFIDDGSTDNSLLMLNQFAEKHDHIRLVIQQNQGQTRARMNGIAQSTGEFLAFLDSDDTWHPHKIEKQLAAFREETSLVYSGYRRVAPDGTGIEDVYCNPNVRGPGAYRHLLISNQMMGGTVMVRRDIYDAAGGFDASFDAAENWDLWTRVAALGSVEFVDELLVDYLVHPGSMSVDREKMEQANLKFLQKHLPELPTDESLRPIYLAAWQAYWTKKARRHFKDGDYGDMRASYRNARIHGVPEREDQVRQMRALLGRYANKRISQFLQVLRGS